MGNIVDPCAPIDQGYVETNFILCQVKIPAHILIKILAFLPIQYIYGSNRGLILLNQTFYNFLTFHHSPLWDHFHSTYHLSSIPNMNHLDEMDKVTKNKEQFSNFEDSFMECSLDRFMNFEKHILTKMMKQFAKVHLYPSIQTYLSEQEKIMIDTDEQVHLPVPPSLFPIFPFEINQPRHVLLNYAIMDTLKNLSLIELNPGQSLSITEFDHIAMFLVFGQCALNKTKTVLNAPSCIKVNHDATYVALSESVFYVLPCAIWKKSIDKFSY